METEGGLLYLARYQTFGHPDRLSLYKLKKTEPKNQEFTLELILEREREDSTKFGTNKDIPVLVNKKRQFDSKLSLFGTAFVIDQFHETEEQVEVRSANIILSDSIADYSFSSPHLAVLEVQYRDKYRSDHSWKLILKVWNIERSPSRGPLYSIIVDEVYSSLSTSTNVTLLLQKNLIRVSRPGKIFVFDAKNIEDWYSVLNSRREFTMDVVDEETVVLFNKFLGVSKQQDTITFYNFWK